MRLQLHASTYALAEYRHTDHSITLPLSFPYDQLFERDAWAHIGSKFKAGDIIHVRDEAHTFYARLYVRAADRLWVDAVEIEKHSLTAHSASGGAVSNGLKVEWRGKAKWSVVRESDNERVKDGFPTAEDAKSWLDQHNQKVAA
jgi:hypothetical protein